MSKGKHEFKVLSNAYDKNSLIEQGKQNGVNWTEDKHEGKNWMRFSSALVRHLDEGNDFDIEDSNPDSLNQMKDLYHQLRDLHKQSMVPHVRAAMSKIHSEKGDDSKHPMDYLDDAYNHLDANGGHIWAEKVRTLNHFNQQIKKLSDKIVQKL
jgi:hypothetical protein